MHWSSAHTNFVITLTLTLLCFFLFLSHLIDPTTSLITQLCKFIDSKSRYLAHVPRTPTAATTRSRCEPGQTLTDHTHSADELLSNPASSRMSWVMSAHAFNRISSNVSGVTGFRARPLLHRSAATTAQDQGICG
eukprot:c15162_g1_i1.p1 GENE.c15162_g1_i1~~c15162_g1_i1.p1  ORF type:complete len:153 (+),score=18.05 c15162_g1_i1:57-461(+)